MIEDLYKKFYGKLYQYGSLVYNDSALVEDTIQNFYMWFLEHPHKLEDIRNFEAFAYKVIRKNIIQRIIKDNRSKDNRTKYAKSNFQEHIIISAEKEIIQIEETLRQKENLKNAIEQLPDKQKEIIYLKYYANFTYKEIEEIMLVSNQVARNYVSRALKKLKATLFPEGVKTLNFCLFFI